jgi:hypothetical protein
MKGLYIAIVTVLMASGCATTPEFVDQCKDHFSTTEDITACEQRIIDREDARARRAEMKRQQAACKWPMVWVSSTPTTGDCVEQIMGLF